MLKNERLIPGSILVFLVCFLSTALCLAAGPNWGAPGGASPARPGSQNAAPDRKPAVDPKNCPTCLQNGMKTSLSGNQLFLIGENGKSTLAKDGSYRLQDGSTIIITKGKVASQVRPGTTVTRQPAGRPAEAVRGNNGQEPRSDPGALKPVVGQGSPTDAGRGAGNSPLNALGGKKASSKKDVTSLLGVKKSGGRKVKPGSQVSGSEDEDLEDLEVQR